jgi:nucleotide-binding universal stress UspA family protein
MSYRTILVQVTPEAQPGGHLYIARALARRFDAVLIGVCVSPRTLNPADMYGGLFDEVRPGLLEDSRRASAELRAQAGANFRRICGDASQLWKEAEGDPASILFDWARCADLVVAAQPGTGRLVNEQVLNHLLIGAGPPVLVLPPTAHADFGKSVLIGWDGSREAYRATHDSLPFLQRAERVTLCAVGERAARTLVEAATMLRRHDVSAHLTELAGARDDAGHVLLEQREADGADLLVMGAYGHSRLQELVFGGATKFVLHHATVPVLFAS